MSDPGLVRYNVTPPNKAVLQFFIALGRLLIAAGAALAVITLIQWGNGPHCGPSETWDCTEPDTWPIGIDFRWYHWIAPLLSGIVIAAVAHYRFTTFYRYVYQGKVVRRLTWGGGNYRLEWVLVVEGYTLANELRCYSHVVDAGVWYDHREGDYIKFE